MNESICFTVEEYKSTFQHLLNEFILATAKTELDFFNYQLEIYNNANVVSHQDFEGALYGGTVVNMDKFQEVIAFIRLKIAECKYGKTEVKEVEIDLSETNGREKIIYLQKMGIIDFLRTKTPFNTNTHSLASFLSGITGIKTSSIYPMINPIVNNSVSQTNNPMNSLKAVEKVEKELIRIGINLKETI